MISETKSVRTQTVEERKRAERKRAMSKEGEGGCKMEKAADRQRYVSTK